MSDNADQTTQTILSNPSSRGNQDFDQETVNRCLRFIDEFKKGGIQKGDAILEIQSILQSAIGELSSLSQLDFKEGFRHFIQLLDYAFHDEESSLG
jgi:hypothetical protein